MQTMTCVRIAFIAPIFSKHELVNISLFFLISSEFNLSVLFEIGIILFKFASNYSSALYYCSTKGNCRIYKADICKK